MNRRSGRRPAVVNNPEVYDQLNHGTLDPRTGVFRPNINARATMSPVDVEAAVRGTHASPRSQEFEDAFHGSALDRATASVENPPAMNNDRGQAAAASLPQTRQVRAVNPAAMTGPNGNVRTDAANLAQNQALYAPGGTVALTGAAAPAVAMAARTAPRKLDPQSNAVQSALDKVIGYEGHPANQTATGVPSNYGSGSVRFANGAGMDDVSTPQAVTSNGKANGAVVGVGRAAFDPVAARVALKAAYPEVYTAGTPENKAFVDHATQYGEQSAHENINSIMAPVLAAKGGTQTTTGAQTRHDIYTPGSTDAVASKNAQGTLLPGLVKGAPRPGRDIAQAQNGIFDSNSTLGKIANFVSPPSPPVAPGTAPNPPRSGVLSDIASGVGSRLGISDAGQAAIGTAARGTANAAIALARPANSSTAAAPAQPAAPTAPTAPQPQPAMTAPPVAAISPRTKNDL